MDKVNPDHYKQGSLQVIDVIDNWNLNFNKGNAVKYILRAGKKEEEGYSTTEKAIEDISKALWYLEHELNTLKRLNNETYFK